MAGHSSAQRESTEVVVDRGSPTGVGLHLAFQEQTCFGAVFRISPNVSDFPQKNVLEGFWEIVLWFIYAPFKSPLKPVAPLLRAHVESFSPAKELFEGQKHVLRDL